MTAIERAIQALVKTAEAEIGYMEKASNSQLNDKTANAGAGNWTKYGAWFDAQRGTFNVYNGAKNGYDWCDIFVDWNFCSTFGIDTGRKMLYQPMNSCGAGCKFSADYFRQNNAWSSAGTLPKVGCQMFFGPKGDESHTELVVKVEGDTITTIGGNTSNRVMRKSYNRYDGSISGYGYPNFNLVADSYEDDGPDADTPIKDDEETPVPGKTCTVTLPVLSIGARGEYVETLQLLLKHYFNPSLGLDGWFGPQTETNVKEYQRKHGEEVDGIVGPITWRLLLR